MSETNLKYLYDKAAQIAPIGSYDDFVQKMQSDKNRKFFYDSFSSKMPLGDYETFESKIAPTQKESKSFRQMFMDKLKPVAGYMPSPSGIPSPAVGMAGVNLLDQAQLLATAGVGSTYRDESFKELYEKDTRPSDLVGVKNEWAKLGIDIALDPLNIPILKVARMGMKALKATSNVEKGKKIVAAIERINKTDPAIIRKMKEDDLIAAFNSEDAVKMLGEIENKVVSPVQQVQDAIKKLPRLLRQQRVSYKAERGKRAAAAEKLSDSFKGEELFIEELKSLKGDLKKVDFSSIRKELPQESVDELFGMVEKTDLGFYDKLTAKRGLAKILGEEGGRVPQSGELKLLKDIFGDDFVKTVSSKTPLLKAIYQEGLEILNVPRALMATADLSAPLRQGMFLIRRQKQFAPAFKEQFKYAFSEKAYTDFMASIKKRPTYEMMEEGGLSLTEMGTDLLAREERFMSNLAEKIPGYGRVVKASNRAYSGFLNKMRADVFDDLVGKAEKLGILNDDLLKNISGYINAATGRGKLGMLQNSAPLLNASFFSPRLVASRIEIMGKLFDPRLYTKQNAFIRKEYLKDLLGFVGTGTTLASISKLAGAEVSTDPRSADFMKIKIGDTRYDTWGGFQQYAVLIYRLLSGKTVSSTTGREYKLGEEGYKPTTKADVLGRGLEFKLAPPTSYAWSAFRGQTAIGKKFEHAPEFIDRMIPIVMQDLYELAEEEGIMGVGMAVPAFFGIGVQTYGDRIPVKGVTPSGRPTTKWELEPQLGERIVNKIKGKQKTTYTPQEQEKLIREREEKIQRNIKIDKAKKEVKDTGKPQTVDDTIIYLEDGIVKTKKKTVKRGRRRR